MKKILSCIMTMCIMGSVTAFPENIAPTVSIMASAEIVQAGNLGDNLTWVLDDEGTLTISGTGNMKNYAGKPWNYAEKVIIEDGVTSIGGKAFENCKELTEITLPDGITSIGDSAFSSCTGLTEITIPDSVTIIGSSAFSSCKGLTEITIPDGVTSIGSSAFDRCTELTEITIPDSVTSIGVNAFNKTPWLEAKQKENPLVIVSDILIDGKTCSGDVVIPNGVTSVCDYAFYGCEDLTEISIPESVTSICDCAFSYCKGLTEIIIPESVTSIGDNAFTNCKRLTEITILNPECEIYDNQFTITTVTEYYNSCFYGTIKGYKNSTAQEYAEKYNCYFQSLDETSVFPLGNLNNDDYIDAVDATAVLMEYAELSTGSGTTLNNAQRKAGDVNGDGEINAIDATLILNYYSEVSTGNKITFPDFISANT